MQALEFVPYVRRRRVERGLCAESEGEFPSGRTEVDSDDPFVATVNQGSDGSKPYRATTEHRDTLADPDLGLISSVHADGEGLCEGGHVER